ncbi:MAG: C45 family autoproteolytic acyltransferase/hydrolase, partial [Thermodesulfobacteriota bacterium]
MRMLQQVRLSPLVLFLLPLLVLVQQFAVFAEQPHPCSGKASGCQFTETVVLPRGEVEFVIVRHIVIRGSNQAIGKKIAEIARERYGVRLAKNPDSIYGKARLSYMERNYPILLERMRGVAAVYGIDLADGAVDISSLPYNFGPPTSCSMICFPGSATDTGHGLIVRSMDYSNGTLSEMLGQKPYPGERDIFSEPYVMEVYPDKGYASLYMSCADLLSGAWDGINSEGLCVFGLVDLGRPKNTVVTSGTRVIGLNPPQIMRLLLDTCANVEEAKIAMLENRIYDVAQGIHYLVADRHGNSFIFEVNHLDQRAYITDNGGNPQVMTNSPVWALPSPDKYPKEFADEYDSLYRYQVLENLLHGHKGKYTFSFMVKANEKVFPRKATHNLGGPSMTLRPVWQVVYDQTRLAMKIR